MDEPFELPVTYKGQVKMFPAQLLNYGYIHKFKVDVYGQEVLFEPDEERNYRAMVNAEQVSNYKLDVALLQAITEAIKDVLSNPKALLYH